HADLHRASDHSPAGGRFPFGVGARWRRAFPCATRRWRRRDERRQRRPLFGLSRRDAHLGNAAAVVGCRPAGGLTAVVLQATGGTWDGTGWARIPQSSSLVMYESFIDRIPLGMLFLLTAAIVILPVEIGFRLGTMRRRRPEHEDEKWVDSL